MLLGYNRPQSTIPKNILLSFYNISRDTKLVYETPLFVGQGTPFVQRFELVTS
jgi:hypothetical protein